jgi:FMN-dependent NADH-azoreductase
MEAFDMQKKYMELFLGFIGFENIQSSVVGPTLQGEPSDIQTMLDASIQKARSLASNFLSRQALELTTKTRSFCYFLF